jgi:hypothetical protein
MPYPKDIPSHDGKVKHLFRTFCVTIELIGRASAMGELMEELSIECWTRQ